MRAQVERLIVSEVGRVEGHVGSISKEVEVQLDLQKAQLRHLHAMLSVRQLRDD